ncbi:hypothetical protein [Bradyrhizobium sp.]
MEKRIAASWCLPESNARIARDVPRGGAAAMIFVRPKIWAVQHATKRSARNRAVFRHCERSEAIQPREKHWIASSLRSSQ